MVMGIGLGCPAGDLVGTGVRATVAPLRANSRAAVQPAVLAPTTATSNP
jgi:hypothetical protein